MEKNNTMITIYYHDEQSHKDEMNNLIMLVGKSKFESWHNSNKVKFSYLDEYKKKEKNT